MTDPTQDLGSTGGRSFGDLFSLIARIVHLARAERDVEIARYCQEHPGEDAGDLRRAVEEALEPRDAVEPAVLTPAEERLRRLKDRPRVGERYTLRGEVSRGGMGVILKAYDEDLCRNLAMKVILGDVPGDENRTPPVDAKVLTRFLDEAQVTGQLDHPGVVPVHELGLDPQGRVYFTMRLVKGRTAHDVFRLAREGKEGWTLVKALEVVLKICDTLAYAHDKGVIHRDLKPANVMVGRFGEVYVMDWGLAKVLGQKDNRDLRVKPRESNVSRVVTERSHLAESDPDSPVVTMDGAVVGTPSYMPPEQAAGRVEELGPRSDVYAVGAMLYSLLTGRLPYLEPHAKMSPYTVLGLVLQGPPRSVHGIDPSVPAELVAICEKAMARQSGARYADARELADDLRAFLEDRVVRAYRTGAVAEMRAWVRRNRGVAAAAGAALLTLIAGGAGTALFAFKASDKAELASKLSYRASVPAANRAFERGQFGDADRLLEEAPAGLRGWEWRYLRAQLDPGAELPLPLPVRLCSAAYTPDGTSVFMAGRDGRLRICDARSRQEKRCIAVSESPLLMALPLDPSGSRALTVTLEETWNLELRGTNSDSARKDSARSLRGSVPELPLAWSPDRGLVVLAARATGETGARVISTADGTTLATLVGHRGSIEAASFSPDGARLVTASADGTARIWDARTGRSAVELAGHTGAVTRATFSPDGRRVATASRDGTARIWNATTGDEELPPLIDRPERGPPPPPRDGGRDGPGGGRDGPGGGRDGPGGGRDGPGGGRDGPGGGRDGPGGGRDGPGGRPRPGGSTPVHWIAFSPDGREVVTATGDHMVRRWRADDGARLSRHLGHTGAVQWAEFDATGERILSRSSDGTAQLWSREEGPPLAVFRGMGSRLTSAGFSPDGEWVMIADDRTVRLHRVPTWVPSLKVSVRGVRDVRPCGMAPWLAVRGDDARVEIWNPESGQRLAAFSGCDAATTLPDGEPLLVTGNGGSWQIRRPLSGSAPVAVPRDSNDVCCELSSDGSRLAIGQGDGGTRILETSTGRELAVLRDPGTGSRVEAIAFSLDGSRVVTGAADRSARLFGSVDSGASPSRLGGHDGPVRVVAISGDGHRLATAAQEDGAIRLWDAADLGTPRVLRCHQDEIRALAFHPDGTRLASLSSDGTLRLWDTVEGVQLLDSTTPHDRGGALAFSRDGTQLFVGGHTVRIFDAARQGERSAESLALLAARPEAEQVVSRVMSEASDYATAGARIAATPPSSPRVRAVALDVLLARMAGGLPARPR